MSAPSGAPTSYTRAELMERLASLDWTVPHDFQAEAQRDRVIAAAHAVGQVAVESEIRDMGHHGGWQLRTLHALEALGECTEAIQAGFGFELDNHAALEECRWCIAVPEDSVADLAETMPFDLAALPLLAYPLSPHHQADPKAGPTTGDHA